MEKKSVELTILNKLGLHARAAAALVQLTNRFESRIEVEKNGETVNGKSIMGIVMLAAAKGHKIVVNANGPDAAEALEAIKELVFNKFGEE